MTAFNELGSSLDVARAVQLAETFVVLADGLVDDYDVVELLDMLVTRCVDLLDVSAAGLMLADRSGRLQVVAASSEQTRLLEMMQLQNEEGPCLDCVRTGVQVLADDLSEHRERWPRFVPAAAAVGYLAVHAIPLRLRSQTIGALNLFDMRVGERPATDLRIAQALSDVATISILQQRAVHRNTLLAEQLQTALQSRVVIEQAKGVLAERLGVDMQTAFLRLRRFARDHNRKLGDVASDVVADTTTMDAFARDAG